MKKIISILLIVAAIFVFAGCGGEKKCAECIDLNNDGRCENCGRPTSSSGGVMTPILPVIPEE